MPYSDDEGSLTSNIAGFLAKGLRRGRYIPYPRI